MSAEQASAAAVRPADIHAHRILILDFGAQYTQLIARRVRESGVYCEIHPWDMSDADVRAFGARGIILSGGPESVTDAQPPQAPQAMTVAVVGSGTVTSSPPGISCPSDCSESFAYGTPVVLSPICCLHIA